jgi:Carboxypeptidase regulatory-like domain
MPGRGGLRNPAMHIYVPPGLLDLSSPVGASRQIRPRKSHWRAKAFLVVILGCALLIPAHAQPSGTVQVYSGPAAPSAQTRVEKFPVTGTVINALTGEPIRKALVQINGQQQRTVFSDGDGRFQFDAVPAGSVSLSAQKPGYFGEHELRTPTVRQFEVGPKSDSVVLKLTPEGVISGKVTTTAGMPLEHVPVTMTHINVREGRKHWEPMGNQSTGEDGRFHFANLRPGTYFLSAGPITPLMESVFEVLSESRTGYPGVYFPGVPDMASASPIELSAGQTAEANFSLDEVPVYKISGTISGYVPNQGVSLQLCDQAGTQVPMSYEFSPDNGRFDFRGVPAGTYVLKAFSQSAPNQPVRAEVRITLASDQFNLRLALVPAASIPLVVRTESVAQPPGPGVVRYSRSSSQGPPLGARLLSSQPGASETYAGVEGAPGQQNLVFRNVEAGRYTVELMPQAPWYVQSAEYGQTNLLTDDLVLTSGVPPSTIQVTLRNDVATLTGTVTQQAGANMPATIVAIPGGLAKAAPQVSYYYPPQDKNSGPGEFTLSSLAPGDYTVLAFDHAEDIEYSNPDVLQNYTSQAAHVTLAPGQRATVTLELVHTGESSN